MFKSFDKQIEKRSSYTDSVFDVQILQASADRLNDAAATAAVEASAMFWSLALASATVSPRTPALSPEVLANIGRQLVKRGQVVYIISTDTGSIKLELASGFNIEAGDDPDTWLYRVQLPKPNRGHIEVIRPGAALLHFRYAPSITTPWRGVAPWRNANVSATLLGNLEGRLAQEAGTRVGYLLPVPVDGGDDSVTTLKSDISKLAGNTALVETTSAGWGDGKAAAPQTDWKPRRMGADPPESLTTLRSAASQSVLSSCGIPPSLVEPGTDAAGQREAWRRFVAATVRPLARIVEVELERKLERPLTLSFDDLRSDDLTGRARAYKSLNESGMDRGQAAELCGFVTSA